MAIQHLHEPVSVELSYDHKLRKVRPQQLEWAGKQHQVTEVGYHHTKTIGSVLYHIFSVTSKSNYFKLTLNTQNLHWHLEATADNVEY